MAFLACLLATLFEWGMWTWFPNTEGMITLALLGLLFTFAGALQIGESKHHAPGLVLFGLAWMCAAVAVTTGQDITRGTAGIVLSCVLISTAWLGLHAYAWWKDMSYRIDVESKTIYFSAVVGALSVQFPTTGGKAFAGWVAVVAIVGIYRITQKRMPPFALLGV